jgi:cytosine/adenosine deaminase-related metal-dependent hydrolase
MSAKARRAIVNGPIFTGTQVLHGHAVILKSMHSNMLKTYKTAYELARHLHHAARVGFAETLAMYHATQALAPAFFSDCRGRLEPGTRADIAVLDYRPHTPIADDNVWGHLLYGAAEAPVHATIAGGELAYHADVCATIDAPATTAACQAAAAQLWQRMASVQELSN